MDGAALQWLWWLLGIALVVGGIVGAVLPILPGLPMVFGGLLLLAWADDFAHVGRNILILISILLAIGVAADFIASSLGAKRAGAGPRAAWGALIGGLVGMFFGIPGLLIGPFLGAVVGELSDRRSLEQATRAGIGTWIGLLVATAAKVGLAFAMVGIFLTGWFL